MLNTLAQTHKHNKNNASDETNAQWSKAENTNPREEWIDSGKTFTSKVRRQNSKLIESFNPCNVLADLEDKDEKVDTGKKT